MTGLDDWTHRMEETDFCVFPLGHSLETRMSEVEVVD